jgi:hypothetical protein
MLSYLLAAFAEKAPALHMSSFSYCRQGVEYPEI